MATRPFLSALSRLALVIVGVASVGTVFAAVVAVFFARTIVTPPKRRADDVRILASSATTVTLSRTPDSTVPGRYGLWFERDSGFARVGAILRETAVSVERELVGEVHGELATATRGRMSGWYYSEPGELGLPFEEVLVETELGPAPAWLVPADRDAATWVIQVHGRAVRREEALRAVPVFHRAGVTSLLISYRNDGDAPSSADARYGLGATEWRDVDAALRFARDRGASRIVLMGWSMGGATVLQTLTRSSFAPLVRGLVLESPVIDWRSTLEFQGELNGLVPPIRNTTLSLISSPVSRVVTGQAAPVDFQLLDFVARADELTVPILLLHSDDDGFVPATASRALATARPDIVTFEAFTVARHTKLWNYDPARWEHAIERWLSRLP